MTNPDPIRIGLTLPTWPLRGGGYATWAEMRELARGMEALGVDTLWVSDDLQRSLPGRPLFGFWECWTILTAAAEATTRIEIGPFVACTGFRNPALLVKMADTLDEVSGGRVVLGLGSGVPARDYSWRAFGFAAERHVGRFAESVEVTARMLREPPVTFAGTHVRTDGAVIVPRGPRPNGLPVWVAALGERTAEVAARWGDAANVNTALCATADVTGDPGDDGAGLPRPSDATPRPSRSRAGAGCRWPPTARPSRATGTWPGRPPRSARRSGRSGTRASRT